MEVVSDRLSTNKRSASRAPPCGSATLAAEAAEESLRAAITAAPAKIDRDSVRVVGWL